MTGPECVTLPDTEQFVIVLSKTLPAKPPRHNFPVTLISISFTFLISHPDPTVYEVLKESWEDAFNISLHVPPTV